MAKEFIIFISHSWAHSDQLDDLKALLENRGYLNVVFSEASKEIPINSENSVYIKKRLKEKITGSNIVLGLAGIYASHSDWMEWELCTAFDLGIPIVGVIPRGQILISKTVTNYSKENVRWNTESIVNAIRKWAL